MIILQAIGVGLFIIFFAIVFRGAPYVPTHKKSIKQLFSSGLIKKQDVIIDLGSGDGRLLLAASQRGIRSYGYELNPILVLVSCWRTRRFRRLTTTHLRDFWLSAFPDDTTVVYVFLATHYMKRLDMMMLREASRLGRGLTLISHGVDIEHKSPDELHGALLVYRYQP